MKHPSFDELQVEMGAADAASTFNLKGLLLRAMARSFLLILVCAGVGGAVGLYKASTTPDTYESQAKLLLRAGKRESLTAEVAVSEARQPASSGRTTLLEDEIHLLTDISNYVGVVRALGADLILRKPEPVPLEELPAHMRLVRWFQEWTRRKPARARTQAPPSEEDLIFLAARILAASTTVSTGRNSNVITVVHTSSSAQKAKHVTEALVAGFIDRHRRQYSLQDYLTNSENLVGAARERMETADNAYFEHIKACGFIDIDAQRSSMLTSISQYDVDLFTALMDLEQTVTEREELQARMDRIEEQNDGPPPSPSAVTLEYDTVVDLQRGLLTEKANLPQRGLTLNELRSREEKIDADIQSLDERLDGLLAIRGITTEHDTLVQRIKELRVEDLLADKRVKKLETRLGQARGELDRISECTSVHAAMLGARDAAKREHDDLFARSSSLKALNSIDIEGKSNLRVLQAPILMPEKVGPNRSRTALMGLGAGLALGLGLAVLRQLLDKRLRHPSMVAERLDVPVIGVVPETRAVRRLRRVRRAV